jgi:hypothetical protein
MMPELKDLLTSPDQYLHSFQVDAAMLMPMSRDAYHRSIFLDGRISPAANRPARVPVQRLTGAVPSPLPLGWIFHVAHCGSTLLARALDQLHTNLVLREPLALRQLAFAPDAERLSIVTSMLSRRYREELPTIVKANVPVNFLLPELAGLDASARAIFLQLGLDDYLAAVLRNDSNRLWLRRVTTQLNAYLGDLTALSDAEKAAVLWLAQIDRFASAIAHLPGARTLDAEVFFAAPKEVIKLAAGHLQVPMTDNEIEAVVAGQLFATYSKDPGVAFDNDMRLAQRAEREGSLAPELEQARNWIANRGGSVTQLEAIASAALTDDRGSAAAHASG